MEDSSSPYRLTIKKQLQWRRRYPWIAPELLANKDKPSASTYVYSIGFILSCITRKRPILVLKNDKGCHLLGESRKSCEPHVCQGHFESLRLTSSRDNVWGILTCPTWVAGRFTFFNLHISDSIYSGCKDISLEAPYKKIGATTKTDRKVLV